MLLPYVYIINDITYQCCAYSYSFEKIYRKFRISRINHRMNRVEVLVAYK